MKQESRVKKSIQNAKVNLLFYVLMLGVSFFSRKAFLDQLGADFVGLTGTLQNILGFLNLVELGIGSSVSYALYGPIARGERESITQIVSLFGYLYRWIGGVILAGAVLISLFIPLIFKHTVFELGIIYFAFWAFLCSSLLSYFVNYRQILLVADQRRYVVTIYSQTASLIKTLLQLALAYALANLYVWVAIEWIYGLLYAVILNSRIDKTYPWLHTQVALGKQELRHYPEILQKTKQIFVHKMKDFLLKQSDQILIFAFVSLKMVAYYGNYVLVIGRLTDLFNTTLDSIGAGIGNLIAEGDKRRIYQVFWEMVSVRYLIAGIVDFSIYHGVEPFICLWLGEEYLLSPVILVLLLVNTFIMLSRGAVDLFNMGYGNYHDTWSAWVEGAINVTVTLVTCYYWGLAGVLIGKIASLIPIIVIWKPLFLYRTSFKLPIADYWKGIAKHLLAFAGSFALASQAVGYIPLDPYQGFAQWVGYCVILTSLFIGLYVGSLLLLTQGAKGMLYRLISKIR